MKNEAVILPEKLNSAAHSLAENLLVSEPFVRYQRAVERFNADPQAQKDLEQLSALQSKVRGAQPGGVDPKDIARLRELQEKVKQNPAIMEYAQQQELAINSLREINQEISQLLGMDFAALARQSTC